MLGVSNILHEREALVIKVLLSKSAVRQLLCLSLDLAHGVLHSNSKETWILPQSCGKINAVST